MSPGASMAANVSNLQTMVTGGGLQTVQGYGQSQESANLAASQMSALNLQVPQNYGQVQGEVWGLGQNSGQNTQWGNNR